MRKHFSLSLCAAACAALLTIDGVAQRKLTTLFTSDNGGSPGWTVFFDLAVIPPIGVWVTALEVNTSSAVHTNFTVDVYRTPTTYVGNDGNISAWTLIATGETSAAARNTPTVVTFTRPFQIPTGSHGIALYYNGGSPTYTNGTGSNQNYNNADLALVTGLVRAGQFTGTIFTPRVWNGSIYYDLIPAPASFVTYGVSCAGTNGLPSLAVAPNSAPKLGTTLTMSFGNLPTQPGPFPVLLGVSRTTFFGLTLPFHLTVLNMPNCYLFASAELSFTGVNTGGTGTASLGIPNSQSLLGGYAFFQGLIRDPGANPFGLTTTNAAQIIIGL